MGSGVVFAKGDILPDVTLFTPEEEPLLLGARCSLGVPVVLWVPDGAADPLTAAMLASQFEAIVTAGARVFAVFASQALYESLPQDLKALGLVDPNGSLRDALGLDGSGLAALDADGRILMVGKANAFGEALSACRSVFERTRPTVIRAQAPVLMIADVLQPELCAAMIAYWERGEKLVNAVASAGRGGAVESTGAKRRTDVLIGDPELHDALTARIMYRVRPIVEKAFCFRIAAFQQPRIGCYDAAEAGAFRRHRDNMTEFTRSRRFAMTLNLNTGSYEGGALWFPEFGRQLYAPEAGGAVVFSCSLLHEALPVISGRRFGVFTFFFDELAAAERDDLLSEIPEHAGVIDG